MRRALQILKTIGLLLVLFVALPLVIFRLNLTRVWEIVFKQGDNSRHSSGLGFKSFTNKASADVPQGGGEQEGGGEPDDSPPDSY